MLSQASLLLQEAVEIARAWDRRKQEISRRERQSRARWAVLDAMGPGKTVPQIARQLRCARQSVQRVADRLSEAGALRFEPNPDHKRSPVLRPTELGVKLRDRIDRELRGWQSTLEELTEAEDIETALLVLRALRAGLEE